MLVRVPIARPVLVARDRPEIPRVRPIDHAVGRAADRTVPDTLFPIFGQRSDAAILVAFQRMRLIGSAFSLSTPSA